MFNPLEELIARAQQALAGKATSLNREMHAEAQGELRERAHVCQFLLMKGHPDLADAIAREEHWR